MSPKKPKKTTSEADLSDLASADEFLEESLDAKSDEALRSPAKKAQRDKQLSVPGQRARKQLTLIRGLLKDLSRKRETEQWAAVSHELGIVLEKVSRFESTQRNRATLLEEAEDALFGAIAAYLEAQDKLKASVVLTDLGRFLYRRAKECEVSEEKVLLYYRAEQTFRHALTVIARIASEERITAVKLELRKLREEGLHGPSKRNTKGASSKVGQSTESAEQSDAASYTSLESSESPNSKKSGVIKRQAADKQREKEKTSSSVGKFNASEKSPGDRLAEWFRSLEQAGVEIRTEKGPNGEVMFMLIKPGDEKSARVVLQRLRDVKELGPDTDQALHASSFTPSPVPQLTVPNPPTIEPTSCSLAKLGQFHLGDALPVTYPKTMSDDELRVAGEMLISRLLTLCNANKRELADAVGASHTTISRAAGGYAGDVSPPSLLTVRYLAALLEKGLHTPDAFAAQLSARISALPYEEQEQLSGVLVAFIDSWIRERSALKV